LIPSGWTICKHHVDKNEVNECKNCLKPHINTQKYPVITPIQVYLHQKRQKEKIPKLIEKLYDLKSLQNDPYSFINDYFEKIKSQTDLSKNNSIG
jgi:hypothetical protein